MASIYPVNYWEPIELTQGECQVCGETYAEEALNEDGHCKHCIEIMEELEVEENEIFNKKS